MVLPDVSDVPLTKNLQVDKPPFNQTYYEWLATRGTQLTRHTSAPVSGGLETIYTVPEDVTLFITSAFLCAAGDTAAPGIAEGNMIHTSGDIEQSFLSVIIHTHDGNSNSNSYPIPLRFESGTVIIVDSTENTLELVGGFTGFTVQKKLVNVAF